MGPRYACGCAVAVSVASEVSDMVRVTNEFVGVTHFFSSYVYNNIIIVHIK